MSHARKSLLKNLMMSMLAGMLVAALHGADSSAAYDVAPTPVKTPPPVYPVALKRAGISGIVAIRITVDELGSVTETSLVKSSNAEFDEPALTAVKTWKFKAAQKGGNSVRSHLIIPIKFNIDD